MQTEFTFTLPRGFVTPDGQVYQDGVMRLATAMDEVEPLEDPRAIANPAYVSIALLTRVITRLGPLSPVTSEVIETLFASDFAYLQQLYLLLNEGEPHVQTQCPSCGTRFTLDLLAETNGR